MPGRLGVLAAAGWALATVQPMGAAAFGPECSDKLKSWVNLSFCGGLVGQPHVESAEGCRDLCCGDSSCGVWEWCPPSGASGCAHWASARCHTGPAPTKPCPWAAHWVGQATSVLPPPPPPPGPPPPHPGPPPPPPRKPAVSRKQGFSGYLGANYSCGDAAALGLETSWWYTWMTNAAQYLRCPDFAALGAEFVPMINGVGQLDHGVSSHFAKEWASTNAHYLLGYNEPDFGNGHNHPHMVNPADAAKDWVNVQAAADELGLALVSPAVSTTGLDDAGVSPWLDQFFDNCTMVPGCNGSKIAFIAFHDYGGNASRLVGRAEGLHRRYGRPTWITEFAINKWARLGPGGRCDDCNITRPMTDAYMAEVLPALDRSDAVHRYAWYSARDRPAANINAGNLLEWNVTTPTLTTTGVLYKSHSSGPPGP